MIVHPMPDGRLLCIHQTSHALMAEMFCRHWGNRAFATPQPYAAVMLGIAQHDNGWYEWECTPQLRADGYPMDFIHGPTALVKLDLWQRGIDRVYAQHPYAGLLAGRHAALLYHADLNRNISPQERVRILDFIHAQERLLAAVRREFGADASVAPALDEAVVLANTRLLQFGDTASLQVCVPWGAHATLRHCPVDFTGTETEIEMRCDETAITFSPWPFGVDEFEVSIHGRLLDRQTFTDDAQYQAALAAAPYHRLVWKVTPAG